MPLTSEPDSASSVSWTERSAPSEIALRSARSAESGPIVTATTSSTSTWPPSLSCIAASMACVSNGFRFFSPQRSRRPVERSIRFSTAASGTSFTRTQIFTEGFLLTGVSRLRVPESVFVWYSLTDESIYRVARVAAPEPMA